MFQSGLLFCWSLKLTGEQFALRGTTQHLRDADAHACQPDIAGSTKAALTRHIDSAKARTTHCISLDRGFAAQGKMGRLVLKLAF
jgi:hypothetical protein